MSDVRQEAGKLLDSTYGVIARSLPVGHWERDACDVLSAMQREIDRLTNQARHDDDAYADAIRLKDAALAKLAAQEQENARLTAENEGLRAVGGAAITARDAALAEVARMKQEQYDMAVEAGLHD